MVHTEVLETPAIRPGQGVWTSYGSAEIKAPASKVWSAIKDLKSYKAWNAYTPEFETSNGDNELKAGDKVTVHYRPDPAESLMKVPCVAVAVANEDMMLCWRGEPFGIPTWILTPEKVQRVTPRGEQDCVYEIFETQSGPMAYLVKWTMGAKQSAMNQGIADALKRYVEGGSQSRQASR